MQESLFNTVQKLQTEQKINVEELEVILNSDIEEVVTLCKKACLKPKTDSMGNAYFTKGDVDILKKMKELYSHAQNIQKEEALVQNSTIEPAFQEDKDLDNPNKKINFLTKAKNRVKSEASLALNASVHPGIALNSKLENLEKNLINKMSELLSDEIIVELIRAKTENENLRSQVNSLNKQVFILKGELACFVPMPFGLYAKKNSKEL